jgi:hypothetical protein
MKYIAPLLLICALSILSGCATNDFKVVDALRAGMTESEVHSTIASFGFQRFGREDRPPNGWPENREMFMDLAWRAGMTEKRKKQIVLAAEYYPVQHGMFGVGHLFLFYGQDGKLVEFYRQQIN